MPSINKLPKSNKEALGYNNSLAKIQEPESTESATQHIVHILDANMKRQIFQTLLTTIVLT